MPARHFCGDNCGTLHRLFEPGSGLMVFKNMSEAAPPSLSELWRRDILGMKREGRAVPVKTDNERSATVSHRERCPARARFRASSPWRFMNKWAER